MLNRLRRSHYLSYTSYSSVKRAASSSNTRQYFSTTVSSWNVFFAWRSVCTTAVIATYMISCIVILAALLLLFSRVHLCPIWSHARPQVQTGILLVLWSIMHRPAALTLRGRTSGGSQSAAIRTRRCAQRHRTAPPLRQPQLH